MNKLAASSDLYRGVHTTDAIYDELADYCMRDVLYAQGARKLIETLSLPRRKPMFSAQTRKDFATRGLVADNTLALLSRARGLDLLQRDEQSEYRVDKVLTADLSNVARSLRPELGEYLHLEWDEEHAAVVHKLDQVNYPVPGYSGYDAS